MELFIYASIEAINYGRMERMTEGAENYKRMRDI